MKIIAVIGDSHTWGQGVGAEHTLTDPYVCCGDLRPTPFHYPTYVNLLRNAVNLSTGSSARMADECIRQETGHTERGMAVVTAELPLTVTRRFDLARLFFRAEPEAAEVTVAMDGDTVDVIPLQSDHPGTDVGIELCHLLPKTDGEQHEVTVTVTKGSRALLYRWEEYQGPYAVVNCGIGARAVITYIERYFDRYVAPLRPYAVLFEGCTINNWLQTSTPAAYADQLREIADRIRALTPRQLWHTVSPVWGNQINDWGVPYVDYVETMRGVARDEHIPLADCFTAMEAYLSSVPENVRFPIFFSDAWHPNGMGHYTYARLILPHLQDLLAGEPTQQGCV